MQRERYFDNAATTPIDPRVVAAMVPYFGERWGNANSIHAAGLEAREAVEQARAQVAELIGAQSPDEIVFTSGATESNNWLLRSFCDSAISPFEHSSLYESARALGRNILDCDGLNALFDLSGERLAISGDQSSTNAVERDRAGPIKPSSLLSLMKVNNEIGTVFQPERLSHEGYCVHSDVTQAVGKMPVAAGQFDFVSFSSHKFYGPKGVGVLYARDGLFPSPLLIGGEQEQGFRAGTLNVAGIVGMGAAAEIAANQMSPDSVLAWDLRSIVSEGLNKKLDFRENGGPEVSPYILSVSFYGIEGEGLVIEMDRRGFAISSGAACSARSTEPSHVLTALGLEPAWLRGTVRISFGRFNTKEAAHDLVKALNAAVDSLKRLSV